MKKQQNVKGILNVNSLTDYPYYRIDGGSMSGDTYLLTYTNVTGTTIGSTNIVSYPTGTTSSAEVVNNGSITTVTTDTFLLVKLHEGQSATINGYDVQNINGDFYFDGVKYNVGDTFDKDGLTFTFVGFGSFLLEVVDTDSSAVTSITVDPTSGSTVTGSTVTLVFEDQNSVDVTGLIALSGDTNATTYVDSWVPTTGKLTFTETAGASKALIFYYVSDNTITATYTITLT